MHLFGFGNKKNKTEKNTMNTQDNKAFQDEQTWRKKLLQELKKVCPNAFEDQNEDRQIGLPPASNWNRVRLILKLRKQACQGIDNPVDYPVVFNLYTPRGKTTLRNWFEIWSEGKKSELKGIQIIPGPLGNDQDNAGNAVVFVTGISWRKQDDATIQDIVNAFNSLKQWMVDSKLDTVLPKLFSI